MRETSDAWFDGCLRYEDVRKGADPEVGMVDSVSLHVAPSSDRVRVYRNTHVICEVQGSRSFSCLVEGETVAEYRSMAEFRASEWWGPTMEKFSGGDADASWLRAVELDGEEIADGEPQWIGYGPSTCVEMGVGSQYRDWLGNTRQNAGHDTLSIRVERMSGELRLRCGEHEVEGTVEEIAAAMALMERLRRIGIEVGYTEIRVPIAEEGDGVATDEERREVTADLSRAVEARLKGKSGIYAPEVEVPGGRVDYMAFHPYNPITMGGVCAATVERGTFACYEVKSCWDDYTSGHGLNFVGDENWLVCPRDLAERLRGKSIGCGILVPDKAGRLRTFVEQPFGGYRKLSASELIWRMLRTSYGIEGGAQNGD